MIIAFNLYLNYGTQVLYKVSKFWFGHKRVGKISDFGLKIG